MTEPTPTDKARQAVAGWTHDDVFEASAVLLGEIHDIDFHHYSDGYSWLDGYTTDEAAQTTLDLADRLTTAAQTAATTIRASLARRDWLLSGARLHCLNCDEPINPRDDEWQVCRGLAEHTWCHAEDPEAEDADRRFTIGEAEHAAYLEERARTGGPRPGDLVELHYPDGHTLRAVWETVPDADGGSHGAARADEYRGDLIDLADVVRIEIDQLAEDAGTILPDGSPVEADWIACGGRCAACHRPLAEAPVVWDAGYPVHRHCIPTTTDGVDAGQEGQR